MTPHRRVATILLPVLLTLAFVACHPVNTIPRPVAPTDPVREFELQVPEDLEIRSVDFFATAFSDVRGSSLVTSTEMGGRAFVKAYAVSRKTGEQVLLIYEDIARRKQPVQIVRFRAVPDSVLRRAPR